MTTSTAVAPGRETHSQRTIRGIVLPQRFDVHEVAQFESAIDLIVAAGAELVVDASRVRYMDRRAMDSLIAARLRCIDHGAELRLACPSVAARVILELSGLYDALNPMDATPGQQSFAETAA